jgi:hypothetical protein
MTVPIEHGFAQAAILLAAELAVETAFFLLLAGLVGVYDLAKELPQKAINKQGHKL